MEPLAARRVSLLLASLVLLDLVLAAWGFFAPSLWFKVWHGASRVDPQGLLARCAANWTGFFILQVVALARWKRERWWLPVVAGARLGDALTDVTCAFFSESLTVFGAIAFPVAGLGNLACGVGLIQAFRKEQVA